MILLTGASGFVGNILSKHLDDLNIPFIAVIRTDASSASYKNSFCVEKMCESTDWKQALLSVDTVIHLAARVHVMNEISIDPLADFRRLNVALTKNLAQQAAKAGVKRFIFLSSIKVNGESTLQEHKFTADDIPNPEDAYAVSKLEAEQSLFKIAYDTGMEVVIIRSPLVYGPGVKANFQSLMNAVRQGIPLPLASVTVNLRSLIAVDNLVDFIIKCITHPNAGNQIFLASDDEDLSTADLLHRMYKAIGTPDKLFHLPLWCLKLFLMAVRKESVYTRLCGSLQLDINKSKQLIGWKPPLSVDEGLRRAFGGQ